MIQPIRRAHRRIFTILPLILAGVAAAALLLR